MRKDENGADCPETLGEYRDYCVALAPDSWAVQYLDGRIAASPSGRDEKMRAPDAQVKAMLMPLLAVRADRERLRKSNPTPTKSAALALAEREARIIGALVERDERIARALKLLAAVPKGNEGASPDSVAIWITLGELRGIERELRGEPPPAADANALGVRRPEETEPKPSGDSHAETSE